MTFVLRDAREAELSQLATKADLDALRQAIRADLDITRQGNKAELDAGRSDIDILRRDIESRLNDQDLRFVARIKAGKAETIQWVLSAIGVQTLVMTAAIVTLSRSVQP